jgi:hypothetical protein
MTTERGAEKFSSGIPIPDVAPEGFGSIPEYLVHVDLVEKRKMQAGIDFTYRPRFFSGGVAAVPQLGTIEADFVFNDPPGLAFMVQGMFLHYEQGADQKARDLMARATLAARGIKVIFIDDSHILENVHYYVGEGLQGRDHSKIARGFM